ncbi:MAG: UbiA family prenyltransferase [Verrucomicrobiota bacterium]
MLAGQTKSTWQQELRTLLILGRVSNLPTVWSNCLAGWWLGGAGGGLRFVLICLGASCLYIAGMFLNDAFDADFDRQYRKERPIPSGAISLSKVWGWGLGWLVAGVLMMSLISEGAMVLALLLAATILLYDAVHKAMVLAPLLMALCRFLLYLLASSGAVHGITGLTIWSGLALAIYIVGLSYLARRESARGPVRYWPAWLLLAPVLQAWVVNAGEYKVRALFLSVLFGAWVVHRLRDVYWSSTISVGRTVSGLLAGICLVDLLLVGGGNGLTASAFVGCFVASLLAQRLVPAT